jgi:hypothetical protein
MSEPSMELVVPGIGQVVNLDAPKEVAVALDSIRDLEYQLRIVKQDLTRALVHASEQAGSKTLRYGNVQAIIRGGTTVIYDAEEIRSGLLAAGMSEERVAEIVVETVSSKVSANEAKRAASANPAYAAVIDAHKTEVDVPPSVSVSISKAEL